MYLADHTLFLDNAAAMPAERTFLEYYTTCACQDGYVNQESIYTLAMKNRARLMEAEKKISRALCNAETHVYWMSTGSESMSILGEVFQTLIPPSQKVIYTPDQHMAVISALTGSFPKERLIELPLLSNGKIDVAQFEHLLKTEPIGLVAIPHVVSETGVVHDLNAIRATMDATKSSAYFFVDMVQAAGKVASCCQSARIDFAVCSAHKLGTVPVAVIVYRPEEAQKIFSELRHRYRAGRPDISACETLAYAIERYTQQLPGHYAAALKLKQAYQSEIQKVADEFKTGVRFFGDATSPWILSFCLEKYQGAILVRMLGQQSVCVGSGSACQSENPNPSYVLTAMGVPRTEAFGLLRLSFSPHCTADEIPYFIEKFRAVLSAY